MLSVFIRDPQFQGQTKDKLTSTKAICLVEQAVKDTFDHWLSSDKENASALLEYVIERAESRKRKRRKKSKIAKPRLKNCACRENWQTVRRLLLKILKFSSLRVIRQVVLPNRGVIVSRKAILPLRGKILNVASASLDKITQNQEIKDMIEALGCGIKDNYKEEKSAL